MMDFGEKTFVLLRTTRSGRVTQSAIPRASRRGTQGSAQTLSAIRTLTSGEQQIDLPNFQTDY
jgi:hypothetical protein